MVSYYIMMLLVAEGFCDKILQSLCWFAKGLSDLYLILKEVSMWHHTYAEEKVHPHVAVDAQLKG